MAFAVDKAICERLKVQGKWQKELCSLCKLEKKCNNKKAPLLKESVPV